MHVYVYYRGPFDDVMDQKIRKIAGKSDIGSGYDFSRGERDLEFSFRDPKKAAAFEKKVKKLKHVRTSSD